MDGGGGMKARHERVKYIDGHRLQKIDASGMH